MPSHTLNVADRFKRQKKSARRKSINACCLRNIGDRSLGIFSPERLDYGKTTLQRLHETETRSAGLCFFLPCLRIVTGFAVC